jgi:hypothetical protein
MLKYLIGGTKRVYGLDPPGRDLDVFPDDVFLVSYPKSGNTWTRFLLANLAYPDRVVDFSTINEVTPDPEALSKRKLAVMPRPRIIKSHQYFDPRYPKVICIVRDPRDVVLSSYNFGIKRRLIREEFPIEDYVPRFLRGEHSDHGYGTWGENVGSWFYLRRKSPHFLLVTYESLLSNTMQMMESIARFLNTDPDPKRLTGAIERSTAERMREMEKKQAHQWSSTRGTRLDKPFVRAARAGGWREELPPACTAAIESEWGELMLDLGYRLTSRPNR